MQRMWQRGPDGEIIRATPPDNPPTSGESESAPPEAEQSVRGRARLALGLRLGLRDTYDYLGAVLTISLLWFLLLGLAAIGGHEVGLRLLSRGPQLLREMAGVACIAATWAIAGGPFAAGIYRFARNAAAREEPELFDLLWGYRTVLSRSIGLAAMQSVLSLMLLGNCVFYITRRTPVNITIGVIFGYALVYWLLASLYQWPLLADQPSSPQAIVRKSLLLVLDNFGYSLTLGFVLLIVSAVLWFTVLGGALFWAGSACLITTQCTRELLRKYGILGPDPSLDPMSEETAD